jgi:hypothetical protein
MQGRSCNERWQAEKYHNKKPRSHHAKLKRLHLVTLDGDFEATCDARIAGEIELDHCIVLMQLAPGAGSPLRSRLRSPGLHTPI